MNSEQYFNTVGKEIAKQAKKNGYKFPSAIIAQSIVESGWGTSQLAQRYFNYFGMKCGKNYNGNSVNMQTWEEYTKNNKTYINDNFRAYNNLRNGIKGYFDFIQYDRYKNLKNAKNAADYIYKLKRDGWATSFDYVNSLLKILKDYNLEMRFDNMKNSDIMDKNLSGNEILNILVNETKKGKYGNGETRKKKLGKLYNIVQNEINGKQA